VRRPIASLTRRCRTPRASGHCSGPPARSAAEIRRTVPYDTAVTQLQGTVPIPGRDCTVGDQQDGEPLLQIQATQEIENDLTGRRIQVSGRLVGEKHLGLRDQSARDRSALLLTSGQLGGPSFETWLRAT